MSNDDTLMLPFDNAAQSSLSLVEHQPQLSLDLIEEIERAVLDKGELSKNEIRDAWGIDNEDYSELQERLLEKNQSIRKGRRKIGGFVVGPRQGRPPREDPDGELLLRTEWERRAVQRLTELLSEKQLKDLLGPLVQVIRRARQEETGVDRNATKPQMAAAPCFNTNLIYFASQMPEN